MGGDEEDELLQAGFASLAAPPGSVLQQNKGSVWSRGWWKESQLGDFEGCNFSMAWDPPGRFWRLNLSRESLGLSLPLRSLVALWLQQASFAASRLWCDLDPKLLSLFQPDQPFWSMEPVLHLCALWEGPAPHSHAATS